MKKKDVAAINQEIMDKIADAKSSLDDALLDESYSDDARVGVMVNIVIAKEKLREIEWLAAALG